MHDVKLVTVVNFPLGTNSIDTTLVQVHEAINEGADEIDTVVNLSAIKMGDYKTVSDEIKTIKGVCGKHNLKVILEVDLLTRDEIKKACLNCITAGADFVKTSTGFLKNGLPWLQSAHSYRFSLQNAFCRRFSYFAAFSASTMSRRSHGRSTSVRPKWP